MEAFALFGSVLGGLGLFLLAIGMMTDGLKLAAGPSLRKILSQWSRTPLRGIFSGFLMTAIVQSSSAVTVASLGFVNAGLMNMRQALGVVYGANIGTTVTSWLVALIGFKVNIHAVALPMIGIGMALKLVKQQGKFAATGWAMVGFGLFFVGVDLLGTAFEGLVQTFDIANFSAEDASGVVAFLLIGVVMTILTQSSSAAIALTITAASSGIVGTYAAAAMVVGANVGTTSTAVLASIGATSNAKRVAAAQVIFNVSTAVVALMILPVLFYVIEWLADALSMETNPALFVALFHTIFNILGVLLIYPLNDRLASFLDKRFLTWDEQESNPRFLDQNVAQTPDLAVNALVLEVQAIADRVIDLYDAGIAANPPEKLVFAKDANVIKSLSSAVSKFIVSVESSALSEDTTDHLATLMRVDQYLLACAFSVEKIVRQMETRETMPVANLETGTISYIHSIFAFMRDSRGGKYATEGELNGQLVVFTEEHERLKTQLIREATRSRIAVAQMSETIDCLAEALHLVQQWYKALIRIQSLQAELTLQDDTDLTAAISSDDAI